MRVTIGRRGLILAVVAGVGGMYALRAVRPDGDVIEQPDLTDSVLRAEGPRAGADDAAVRMAVFTDYRCPNCRAAHAPMMAAAADADVLLLLRDWPVLGPQSERAARIAIAADAQGRYLAVHDGLMKAAALDDASLERAVLDAGADWSAAQAGANGPIVTDRLQQNGNQAFALGLRGTPGYLAGPIRVEGALDEAGFARLFERAAREQERQG